MEHVGHKSTHIIPLLTTSSSFLNGFWVILNEGVTAFFLALFPIPFHVLLSPLCLPPYCPWSMPCECLPTGFCSLGSFYLTHTFLWKVTLTLSVAFSSVFTFSERLCWPWSPEHTSHLTDLFPSMSYCLTITITFSTKISSRKPGSFILFWIFFFVVSVVLVAAKCRHFW